MIERSKIKILFMSSDKFPPFRVDVSVLFGRDMVDRGHKIDWVLQSGEQCENEYCAVWNGSRVWVGKNSAGRALWARIKSQMNGILHCSKVFPLTRAEHYDVVQVKDMFVGALLGLVAARRRRAKFVFWLSFPYPEAALYRVKEGAARYPLVTYIRARLQKYLLYRVIMPQADHIFVQSVQMKRDVCERGVSEKKVTPIPMGISWDEMRTKKCGTLEPKLEGGCSIVYIGTLVKVRKIEFLVGVLALVQRRIPMARLYLVGDGDNESDREMIRQEAISLGVEKSLEITGFIPRAEALAYVEAADVCVSPYYPTPILNSTSPTKLIEYMAMGKAVVANDHPEQRQVIRESGGGICTPYDEIAFANAIEQILKDPERAQEMGRRGKEYVRKYRAYDKITDIVEHEYFKLCG